MSSGDQNRWEEKYAGRGPDTLSEQFPLPVFAPYARLLPEKGNALEIACGRGAASVWLARRGLTVKAVDVSPQAIELARKLASAEQVSERCTFSVHDLDRGLPAGPQVDLLLCHQFRDSSIYVSMSERLALGGILALSVLSEVGAQEGRFRAKKGELTRAFPALDIIAQGEGSGTAWLLARRPAH